MREALVPAEAAMELIPLGEGKIHYNWVKHAFVAEFNDVSKEFSCSKWAGADKASKAAVKWLEASRKPVG